LHNSFYQMQSKPIIVIDPNAGFCFGVVNAIAAAEKELEASGRMYCLGDIVHNTLEVERLKKMGMKVVDMEDFQRLKNCKLMIRAHGEPPETYAKAKENNIEIIDATCPVVLKLQSNISKGYKEGLGINAQIVIYGKEGHAEVNGLVGQTHGEALIVNCINDLDKIDFSRSVYLYAQTTKSPHDYERLKNEIEERMLRIPDNKAKLFFHNTICKQVSNRDELMREFASRFQIVIFVSDPKSSNGKVLFEVCKKQNPNSYFVSSEKDLQASWFDNIENVGISGATSTPSWLMEKIVEKISTPGKE